MHQQLIYSDYPIKPIITSSAFRIDSLGINDVIVSLDQIGSHKFSSTEFNSSDFFEINHFDDYLEESEQNKSLF